MTTDRELPKYKCHKEVWALEIAKIDFDQDAAQAANRESDGSAIITPVNTHFAQFHVDRDYVQKHKPKAGGYYVLYEGGYKSWSPKDVFEKGYAPNADRQMAPKVFKDTCFALRTDIDLEIAQVKETLRHPGIHEEGHDRATVGALMANVTLSLRHLEDAKMRLGKAIEAYEEGSK